MCQHFKNHGAFTDMVRNRDVHWVEEFCKKFTVNEK